MPASAEAGPWSGTVYRICSAPHSQSTLSLRGALQFRGRYHLRGYFGALYTSEKLDTAVCEIGRRLTVAPKQTFVRSELRVRLSRVLDLTDPRVRRKWSVNSAQLISEDYTACQQLALKAWQGSLEGLIAPSAADPAEKNAVLFLDHQHPGWSVELVSVEPVSFPE